MNLTKRFFLMNTMAVLLSIGLTVMAAIIFAAVYTKVLGREADLSELRRGFEVRSGISEIKQDAMTLSLSDLLTSEVQEELSNRVQSIGAGAALFKGRELVFTTKLLRDIDLNKGLLLSSSLEHEDTIELDGTTHMFDRVFYKLPTGEEGMLLLAAPIKLKSNFYWTIGIFTFSFFIAVLLALNFWVSYRFSHRIILPVSRLKVAASKISEGDLSCEIAEDGEGEVRELSNTLEIMRLKLKESIYLQQKYDENRKFLLSSISHDLKTPVTSIKGYIEGILDGVAQTPDKMKLYLETARTKADLVNVMIDDLLLYSKLDLNQLPYHFEKIDLVSYFADCVADNQYEYAKKNVSLELVNELEGPALVRIDLERFRRVIQNILDNAVKYLGKSEGQVQVILRETRASAIIEIKDNGPGIPEKDLPNIFDRFYRADPSRRNADGSGLGLAIAKQIVEGHEGQIWARSTAGEGTRMMISLKKL